MHRSVVRRAAVVVVAGLVAVASGGVAAGGSPGTSVAPAAGDDLDPTVPVRFASSIATSQWDPHRSVSQPAETPNLVLVYDRLLRLLADGSVEPQLATSYEFSEDGLELTLQLRDDVTFHDGSAFDADVVVANLERAKGEESTVASQLTNVVDVIADGPYEVRLVLDHPDPPIVLTLATTTGAMISPAALDSSALDSSTLQQSPAGSGPFVVESTDTERTVFAAAPDYWDDSLFVPDRIEIIGVADDAARLSLLTSGGADIISLKPTTWLQALDLADTDDYDMHVYESSVQQILYLNSATPPLDDPTVRRALNLAIDREAISNALDGACAPNSQVFPPTFPGYVEGLEYEYDPDQARRILDDAGVDEFTLNAILQNNEPQRTIATIVQAMLAEIGVTLNLEPIEPARARPTFVEGQYDAMIHQQSIQIADSSGVLATHVGALDPGGSADALIPAADAARVLPLGSPERTEAYQALDEQLFDTPTHVMICNMPSAFLARSNMVGLDALPYSQTTLNVDLRGVGFISS